jgi:hypothetical protein
MLPVYKTVTIVGIALCLVLMVDLDIILLGCLCLEVFPIFCSRLGILDTEE